MKIRIILLIFLISGWVGIAQKKFNDTIPFKDDLGLIVIPIKFNGIEKNFIFDTGATHSIGFSWVPDELVKTKITQKITSSSKRQSKLRYYKSDSVNLASAKITKHKILATKDSDIFSCYDIDGVLGVDIIEAFNWIINYDQKYLVMLNKDYFPDDLSSMNKIDFQYRNKRPYAFLNFDSERLQFLFDTGATFSDIYIKDYKRIKNINHLRKEKYNGFFDFNGNLTKSKSSVMRFSSVMTKDVSIDGIFDFSKKSNKIGNSLWKNNTLFLSLKNNILYTNKKQIEESRTEYGCAFVYENDEITVVKIVIDSQAWNEGLRQGDIIKMINGKTFRDFCDLQSFQKETATKEEDVTITLNDNRTIVLKKKIIL